jgi:hypothetical protein
VNRVRSALLVGGLLVTIAACGGSDETVTRAEFAARADGVCAEAARRFEAELPEPVGGAKPVGLGPFMRRWVADLREIEAPRDVSRDWSAALDLLVRASRKLDDAEAGDPNAQGEALWVLEARAQEHINAMDVPFAVCFTE